MQNKGYTDMAQVYDLFYHKKDYAGEAAFLTRILQQYQAKTVLDVGCGTGTHMALLEQASFSCVGIDLSQRMLEVAASKVRGNLVQADMTDFYLGEKYDAIVCMFAAFNHLIGQDSPRKALNCFVSHLNPSGIVVIDLHNPQKDGRKEEDIQGVKRIMEWHYDPISKIEISHVTYRTIDRSVEDTLHLRIYPVGEIQVLMEQAGLARFQALEGYCFREATPASKNIEAIAQMIVS